jgi:hypothetical protein
MIRLASEAEFSAMIDRLRMRGPVRGWEEWLLRESPIKVLAGPISHW